MNTLPALRYGPGQLPAAVEPGDIFLTHEDFFVSKVIRLGESIRPSCRAWRWYSHCGVVENDDGIIIEERGHGCGRGHLSQFKYGTFWLIAPSVPPTARDAGVEFARSCVGLHYGFFTIACISLNTLVPFDSLTFGVESRMTCSGMVARTLEHMGITLKTKHDPVNLTPADIARLTGCPKRS